MQKKDVIIVGILPASVRQTLNFLKLLCRYPVSLAPALLSLGASALPAALSIGEGDGAKREAALLTDGGSAPFLDIFINSFLMNSIWLHS